jgi:adenosylhomocysteine nucleosidase
VGAGALLQSKETQTRLTPRLGIVVAMSAEARCLVDRKFKPGELADFYDGGWIQLCGIGPQRAARAAESLLGRGASALLSWGTAGALSPELLPGNLILPKVITASGGEQCYADREWHMRTMRCLQDRVVISDDPLVESETVVAGVVDKAQLFARSRAAAVDMESGVIAWAAARAGVPFLAIRAVADAANSEIPREVLNMFSVHGEWRLSAVIPAVLRRPSLVADCLCLWRDVRTAYGSLRQVARLLGPSLQLE